MKKEINIEERLEEIFESAETLNQYSDDLEGITNLDVHDIAHRIADGSQHVIYYNKARELVKETQDLSEAEEMAVEFGFFENAKSYNDINTNLAYCIVYLEAQKEMLQEIENIKEELEVLESDLSDLEQDSEKVDSLISLFSEL